jgi:RNA polymerase sigma-70 factor (ECF subfamily)
MAFDTTMWSQVLLAGSSGANAQSALEALCSTYWRPVFAYIRSRGHSIEDSKDLTQQFFVYVLEKDLFARADPQRGRFRHFLKASVRNFLANEWDKAQTQKRGGGLKSIRIDEFRDASNLDFLSDQQPSPEDAFERIWALTLLENVLAVLREEWEQRDRGLLFDALKVRLTGEELPRSYGELSREFGMSDGAIKAAAHRLRVRYRELLKEQILETVATESDLEQELRDLQSAMLGNQST